MEVFHVRCNYCGTDDMIVEENQYVTAQNDSMQTVVDYFTLHCKEYDKELISVAKVLTITQRIETDIK